MTSIFDIRGGIGKHIASTAVIDTYKEYYPDNTIIVSCAWPEVFLNNPSVNRVLKIETTPYFYNDYIYNKNCEVFVQDRYRQSSHILKQKHLIETWCDMLGFTYTGKPTRLYFNFRELEISKDIIPRSDKPTLIFQPFGGSGPNTQPSNYSWMRDIHPTIAQILVDELSKTYQVIHICYEFHPLLHNCIRMDKPLSKKVLFALLLNSEKRLLIDSSLQHAAAALGLPSTVQWIGTQSNIFGYPIHTNIGPVKKFENGTIDSYLYDYNFGGIVHECPYSSPLDIFNPEEILKTLV